MKVLPAKKLMIKEKSVTSGTESTLSDEDFPETAADESSQREVTDHLACSTVDGPSARNSEIKMRETPEDVTEART